MTMRKLCVIGVAALAAGCAKTPEDPAQSAAYVAASLGYDAYKQGDLAGAETQFESALSSEPDNPYALLGLGAVRENSGDFLAAERLYTAARSVGNEAKANYTYITERRLEQATNRDVASLAEDNLSRLTVKRAELSAPAPVPATVGFASYDDALPPVREETAVYADDVPTFGVLAGNDYEVAPVETYAPAPVETYAAAPVQAAPMQAYDIAPVEQPLAYAAPVDSGFASDAPLGGNYQQVGSYEDYAASMVGGALMTDADSMVSSSDTMMTDGNMVADTMAYGETIMPATFGTLEPIMEPAFGGDMLEDMAPVEMLPAPFDEIPNYGDPLLDGGASLSEPVTADYASVAPSYAPVRETMVPFAAGPAGGALLQYGQSLDYGQSLGDPVDLVPSSTPPTLSVQSYGSPSVDASDTGGLIFLSDE